MLLCYMEVKPFFFFFFYEGLLWHHLQNLTPKVGTVLFCCIKSALIQHTAIWSWYQVLGTGNITFQDYALTDFCLRKGKHFWVPPYYVNCTAVTCQKFYLSSLFQYSNTEKSLWSSSLTYSGTPSQTLCFTLCGSTSSSSAFRYFSFWSAIWSQNSDS